MLDTQARWEIVRERVWIPIDPDRKCWTCGAEPSRRYPDGSPGYDCGPHEAGSGPEISPATAELWAQMVARDLVNKKPRGVVTHRSSVGGQAYGLKAHARRTDPPTSHEAAAKIRGVEITQLQGWILDVLEQPSTDEQIWNELAKRHLGSRLTPSGVRTRRSELVDAGKVIDSKLRGHTAAGGKTIIWQLKTAQDPPLGI